MAGDRESNERLMRMKYLPPCTGPKLQAFAHQNSPITWLERLDDPADGGPTRGHVFRVKIKGQEFALKVFKFVHPQSERYLLGPLDGASISDDLLVFHTDPFYAECRAYGRIEEIRGTRSTNRKSSSMRGAIRTGRRKDSKAPTIAARCYGFLTLSSSSAEGYLEDQGIDLWSEIDPDDDYRIRAIGSPIRAIVKEYIPSSPSSFNPLLLRDYKLMLKSIKYLNDTCKIIHRGIKPQAFHDSSGRFVCFSLSWTMGPHCVMDVTAEHITEVFEEGDKVMFDDMAEEAGFARLVRALPDAVYVQKLRSRGRR